MKIDERKARDIAIRWGRAASSEPLRVYGETGLIEDRKRLAEAIKGIRTFLRHTDELDSLLGFIGRMCPFETAARTQGWTAKGGNVLHTHDYDRAVAYPSWRSCCEGEDIPVEE
jgi:hypothetical protein